MKQSILGLGLMILVSTLSIAQDYQTYDEGIAKFRAQDYGAVIDLFSGMLAKPDRNKRYDEDLYFYRGQSYYFKGETENALVDLDKALELNHFNKAVIAWFKARCYDKKGNAQQADTYYKEAVGYAENNKKVSAQILADRSQFYARQGNKDAAASDLTLAKSLDPSNAEIAKATVSNNNTATQRGGADTKSKTQVIVKNNQKDTKAATTDTKKTTPPAKTVQQPIITTPVQEQPTDQSANTALISSIASTYKDEKRYALVIGNSSYTNSVGILKNPVNDATDVSTELKKSNFEVQLLTNATYVQMREAMRKFQDKLVNGPKDQTVGLFYYAGHGVQYLDENYLVPVDANVQYEDDIVRMCFPVQKMVLANMERSNSRMNIVILDACRNNPFPAATRSVSQGLGEMKRARGSFIAYATAPGSVASDGAGRNGLYTQELLKALRKPGLTIEQVFKDVRMNVLRLSGDKQFTWDSSNIVGEFYFKF
ncbi:caspase family protein [Ohtaekwangia koreensis]|uniref:Tetratricopeptide repeat-containing protein n=1 Tax=Ohtaekwangia koreensis TaxID=688867 RepID=A0A1T5KGE9_9BACT|nr:caspase family protein [Ohtaekwangia koreensis]SKC62711.1 Tetratricopeptide repeat-containing protein [Ohtaekwangia koreensis]